MEKRIESVWDGWHVVQKIGAGGFGAVYEIQRDVFGTVEKAALKVISIPQNADEIQELYNEGYNEESITLHYKEYLEEIVKEYSLVVNMKGHPNVVYCDDLRYVHHEDGIGWDIFIKMELLNPLVKALGNEYNEKETIKLGIGIANALVMCKNHNIVHRDIKPQNIFISNMGDYKLGDFGVAKVSEKTQNGTKIGTFEYMPPEVYKGLPYGVAADIYSLGLVLYWLMNEKKGPFLEANGKVPSMNEKMDARMRRLDGENLPKPLHGSKELQKIVLKACAFRPEDRYASASELYADLQALEAENTLRSQGNNTLQPDEPKKERADAPVATDAKIPPIMQGIKNDPAFKAPPIMESVKRENAARASQGIGSFERADTAKMDETVKMSQPVEPMKSQEKRSAVGSSQKKKNKGGIAVAIILGVVALLLVGICAIGGILIAAFGGSDGYFNGIPDREIACGSDVCYTAFNGND